MYILNHTCTLSITHMNSQSHICTLSHTCTFSITHVLLITHVHSITHALSNTHVHSQSHMYSVTHAHSQSHMYLLDTLSKVIHQQTVEWRRKIDNSWTDSMKEWTGFSISKLVLDANDRKLWWILITDVSVMTPQGPMTRVKGWDDEMYHGNIFCYQYYVACINLLTIS